MESRKLKKYPLRPLVTREKTGKPSEVNKSLEHFDGYLMGRFHLPKALDEVKKIKEEKNKDFYKDEEYVKKMLNFSAALFLAKRLSFQEFVFMASQYVEHYYDSMIFDFPDMKAHYEDSKVVEKKLGLKPGEYWPKGKGPQEYQDLHRRFDRIYEKNFIATLKKFSLFQLAEIRETKPKEFDKLRERGRRAFHHKQESISVITDVVNRYERDAKRAASVELYGPAVILLGAAVEGLLLIRCLKSKRKASKIYKKLKKPSKLSDKPMKWTFENLALVCEKAGWLPDIKYKEEVYLPAGFVSMLRRMRNYIHPGRIALETPWSETSEYEYEDAKAIYFLVRKRLENK